MFFAFIYIVIVIMASWRRPMWGIAVAANAFLFNAILGNSSGAPFILVGLGGPLFCFITLVLNRLLEKKSLNTPFKLDALLVFLFFIVAILSVFYAYNVNLSIEISVRYLVFCASFYFATQFVLYFELDKERAVRDFLNATLVLGVVIGFYAYIRGDSSSHYVMRLTIGEVSSIPLSILLGQSLLIVFYFFVTSKKRQAFAYIPIFLLLVYVLFLTNTRSTLIASALGLGFILIFGRAQIPIKLYFRLLIICAITIPVSVYYLIDNLDQFERAFSGFDRIASGELGESESYRILAWGYALDAFSKNPFLGLGTGNFGQHYIAYPHNMFLEVLAENGLLGFIVVFVLMFLGVKKALINNQGVFLLIAALFIFSLFVAQVSLTMWMHKSLFIWLAFLLSVKAPRVFINK